MEDNVRYENLKELNKKYNNTDVKWEDEISHLMDCTEMLKTDNPTVVG